jgi:hypothetical protein
MRSIARRRLRGSSRGTQRLRGRVDSCVGVARRLRATSRLLDSRARQRGVAQLRFARCAGIERSETPRRLEWHEARGQRAACPRQRRSACCSSRPVGRGCDAGAQLRCAAHDPA